MSWVARAREGLAAGEEVKVRPHGHSMRPKVESGATVTLRPVDVAEVSVGDIVFCKVAGNYYLHLVSAVQSGGCRVQISNNRGKVNGWTSSVYGLAVEVDNSTAR